MTSVVASRFTAPTTRSPDGAETPAPDFPPTPRELGTARARSPRLSVPALGWGCHPVQPSHTRGRSSPGPDAHPSSRPAARCESCAAHHPRGDRPPACAYRRSHKARHRRAACHRAPRASRSAGMCGRIASVILLGHQASLSPGGCRPHPFAEGALVAVGRVGPLGCTSKAISGRYRRSEGL